MKILLTCEVNAERARSASGTVCRSLRSSISASECRDCRASHVRMPREQMSRMCSVRMLHDRTHRAYVVCRVGVCCIAAGGDAVIVAKEVGVWAEHSGD